MDGDGGKRVVVTGASSGIGREIAIQLAAPGGEIWLIGRDVERLNEVAELVQSKGATPHVVSLDLQDLDGSGRYLNENFPVGTVVDEVYLAAAVTQFGEVCDTLPEDWDQIYQTTLMSPVQWAHHFYSGMVSRRAGRIVLISSLAAYTGYPSAVAYATMKAGLLGLFRSLLYEGESHGVSFHIASPGYVDTRIYERALYRKTSFERTMQQIKSLGLPVISAEDSARRILKGVKRGKTEFAVPGYASLMKWIAPRMPFLVDLLHARVIQRFRQTT